MGESVILQLPVAIVLYAVALFLNLFDRHYQDSKGLLTVASAFFSVTATAYSLINGASFWEAATVLLVFLLMNMGVRE